MESRSRKKWLKLSYKYRHLLFKIAETCIKTYAFGSLFMRMNFIESTYYNYKSYHSSLRKNLMLEMQLLQVVNYFYKNSFTFIVYEHCLGVPGD